MGRSTNLKPSLASAPSSPWREFAEIIAKCGFFMAGQTPRARPRRPCLYTRLRDHTGTVESPNLICASIMSKKLAEGINGLVLDVKTGSGAFMTKYEDARHLASLMVATGELAGTRTVALMTAMDEPLGRFSGNWVEVWECVDIMKNVRHPMSADLIELTNILAGWMLYLGGKSSTPQTGAALSNDLLTSGAAYRTWLEPWLSSRAVINSGLHRPRRLSQACRGPRPYFREPPATYPVHGLPRSRLGRAAAWRGTPQPRRSGQRPCGHRSSRQTWYPGSRPASLLSPSSPKTQGPPRRAVRDASRHLPHHFRPARAYEAYPLRFLPTAELRLRLSHSEAAFVAPMMVKLLPARSSQSG